MFLLCCFSATAVSLQASFVSDVFIQLVELNENESKEASEKDTSDTEGDQDPFIHLLYERAYASIVGSQLSSPCIYPAKNIRNKVSTPPPERA